MATVNNTARTANGYGSAYQIGSSGKVSVIVRDSSVWGGANVVVAQSGNGTDFGRAEVISERDTQKTRCLVGIVGEYVKIGIENAGLSTNMSVDIVTD